MKFGRVFGRTASAAATAALIGSAPSAAAGIDDFTISPGLGNGFGTGCSYELKAVSADALRIRFLDDGWEFRNSNKKVSGNTVTATWTPTAPGVHVLTAKVVVGDLAEKRITVEVGTGVNLGSACFVQ